MDWAPETAWSADELEAILDALPARVSWWGSDLRLRYLNEATAARTPHSRESALGREMADFVDQEWLRQHLPSITAALAGQAGRFESTVLGGTRQYSDVSVVPTVVDGVVTGVVLFSVDNTARVFAQERNRISTQMASVLAERQRIAADLSFLVMDRMRETTAPLRQALSIEFPLSTDARRVAYDHLDEAIRTLRTTIHSLKQEPPTPASTPDPAGVRTAPVSVLPDQPERPAGQPARLPVSDLLLVLDALPAAITVWDPEYYNTFANTTAVAAYQLGSRDAVHGRQGAEILGREAYEASLPYGDAAMAGRPQQFLRTRPDPAGGERTAQIYYIAQKVDNVAVGAVALVVDITEQARAEAQAEASAARVAVLGDRARIAEDLHDLVIQRLFAALLMLAVESEDTTTQLRDALECIDDAMEELQLSIYELHGDRPAFPLKEVVDRVVRRAAGPLGFAPTLTWLGDPNAVTTAVTVDLVAVLSEALSNAAKHAHAETVEVVVCVDPEELSVSVRDDGVGQDPASTRRSGIANLASRAGRYGGRFETHANEPHGMVIEWAVPLATADN